MWRPVESLPAGKLAYLHFEDPACRDCLGYVNGAGMADWPEEVRGLRPAGWCAAGDILFAGLEARPLSTQPVA